MRAKSLELKKKIYEFVNDWRSSNGDSPTLSKIANCLGVDRSTVYRYLIAMTEEDYGLTYDGKTIETREFNSFNMQLSPTKLVGSIPCGEAQTEEEYVEEYVNLPSALFGKGEFYLLRATGDSMEDAGISEGDLIVIKKQETARVGDIVVALDDESKNTLKRFAGFNENHCAILEYMNEAVYPNKAIIVKELTVQGVAGHVIKKL